MTTALYWFRRDLRLADQPALLAALQSHARVLLCCPLPAANARSRHGWLRIGPMRLAWHLQAVAGLRRAVQERGGELVVVDRPAEEAVVDLSRQAGLSVIYCEHLATPEELAEVAALRAHGLEVREYSQSTLLAAEQLPFEVATLPAVFTDFRRRVEDAGAQPRAPLPAPCDLHCTRSGMADDPSAATRLADPSVQAFRLFDDNRFEGSEAAGQAYLADYFAGYRPRSYKETRNAVLGVDGSTKLSPWLATGALSARTVMACLRRHEAGHGANESTYWIWFELLWRDYFKFWCARHGARVFTARALGKEVPAFDAQALERWRSGTPGQSFVDAGMRELATSGFLSNRMRQVVASYLVHDLGGDWRAGADWFESCLVDFDVTSNQGNWAYLAGRGADPRAGRRFDPEWQAERYDAQGAYRRHWGT